MRAVACSGTMLLELSLTIEITKSDRTRLLAHARTLSQRSYGALADDGWLVKDRKDQEKDARAQSALFLETKPLAKQRRPIFWSLAGSSSRNGSDLRCCRERGVNPREHALLHDVPLSLVRPVDCS